MVHHHAAVLVIGAYRTSIRSLSLNICCVRIISHALEGLLQHITTVLALDRRCFGLSVLTLSLCLSLACSSRGLTTILQIPFLKRVWCVHLIYFDILVCKSFTSRFSVYFNMVRFLN